MSGWEDVRMRNWQFERPKDQVAEREDLAERVAEAGVGVSGVPVAVTSS